VPRTGRSSQGDKTYDYAPLFLRLARVRIGEVGEQLRTLIIDAGLVALLLGRSLDLLQVGLAVDSSHGDGGPG
jgi:hypothetical protein